MYLLVGCLAVLTSPLPIWLWPSLVQNAAAPGVGTTCSFAGAGSETDARGLIDCAGPRQLPALVGNKRGYLQVAAHEEGSRAEGTTDGPTAATLSP